MSELLEHLQPKCWHGLAYNGVTIHIGNVPGRKQVALYTMEGSAFKVRAYFRTDDDAWETLAALDRLVDGISAGVTS